MNLGSALLHRIRPAMQRGSSPFAAAHGQARSNYTLPSLPYDYNALEPVISEEIMRVHHLKHHQAYLTNFNAALEKFAAAKEARDVSLQVALTAQIRFNGGGYLNHCIFWRNLCPPSKAKKRPEGPLLSAITAEFGSFDSFKKIFTEQSVAIQGSGWGWLGYNKQTKRVQFATTANQDPLQATTGLVPLLGVDVWEHAYYLQYKNARVEYSNAIWDIINWDDVSERFHLASAAK